MGHKRNFTIKTPFELEKHFELKMMYAICFCFELLKKDQVKRVMNFINSKYK